MAEIGDIFLNPKRYILNDIIAPTASPTTDIKNHKPSEPEKIYIEFISLKSINQLFKSDLVMFVPC